MKQKLTRSILAGLAVLVGVPIILKIALLLAQFLFNMDVDTDVIMTISGFSIVGGIGCGLFVGIGVYVEWKG